MLVIVPLSAGLLSGCTSKHVFRPEVGTDVIFLKSGESVTAPKDGQFLSKEYLKHIVKVKLER